MKKTLALASLILGLSLNACNNSSADSAEVLASPSSTSSANSNSGLSAKETSLVGYWACARACEEGTAVSLNLGADRKVAFAGIRATTPVTGARTLGTWKTAGDTLILGITSTDITNDGIAWDTMPYQRTQHMLHWLRGDSLRILISWDTMVFVRTDVPSPLTARVATPVLSKPAGTYPASFTVTLTCATSNAKIHYTTDNSTPTSASAVYTQPIAISSSQVLKAVAIRTGLVNSPTISVPYVISPPSQSGATLADSLVGTWVLVDDEGYRVTTTLNADGTFSSISLPPQINSSTMAAKFTGTWSVTGNTLKTVTLTQFLSSDGKYWDDFSTDIEDIPVQVSVTSTTMTISDSNGYRAVFTRSAAASRAASAAARSSSAPSKAWKNPFGF